jgi:hypothetical protein
MAWLLVTLLLAFITLLVTSLVLDSPLTDFPSTNDYIRLAALACFLLLQIMLVVGVCSAHAKHPQHIR